MDKTNENMFVLTDEEGNDFNFELVDFCDYEDILYAIFAPEEDAGKEEVGVVIMVAEFVEDEPVFTMVEDDDLCTKVLETFMAGLEE